MSKVKRRPVAAAILPTELRDRLERARAAMAAINRAPPSSAAIKLAIDLEREIKSLERDLAGGRNA